jgi:hypothetical protein
VLGVVIISDPLVSYIKDDENYYVEEIQIIFIIRVDISTIKGGSPMKYLNMEKYLKRCG